MLLCCDRTAYRHSLHRWADVPDYIRATPHNLHILNMHQAEEGMYCVDAASVSPLFPMSGPSSDAQ